MRKRIVAMTNAAAEQVHHHWFNLEAIAKIEMTSEDKDYPIESVLVAGTETCWRAAKPGQQIIRLLFDEPQHVKLIRLLFQEEFLERTQEFVLRYSVDEGYTYSEIARQQYNFSSPNSTRELEDYFVDLAGVTTLELSIIPDISGGIAHASLSQWFVA